MDTRPAAGHDGEETRAAGESPQPAIASVITLLAWLSPAFPVGGYAYSHGLEQAVEDGDVSDEASLETWLGETLSLGFGRNDAILLLGAHRVVTAIAFPPSCPADRPGIHDLDGRALDERSRRYPASPGMTGSGDPAQTRNALAVLTDVNDLALAFAPTKELHLETSQQGRSFLDAVLAAWPNEVLREAATALPGEVAYPVAVGLASAAHGVPARDAAAAFLLALAQALVSAGVRLAPIGQTAGARIVARIAPLAQELAAAAETLTLDDLASATFRLDLNSARHETQYTRLFRS